MAANKTDEQTPERTAPKLSKADDTFFQVVGGLGGRATLEKKGRAYYSDIAKLRHQRNREAKLLGQQSANKPS